jgi:carbonic anhydrase
LGLAEISYMRTRLAASALALALAACGGSSHAPEAAHGEEHGQAAHGEAHAEAGHGPALGPAAAHAAEHASGHAPAAQDGAHWSYVNQGAWSHEGAARLCETGAEQSPINLSSAQPVAEAPDLVQHYIAAPGTFVNNGHTLQFTPDGANATLTIGQDAFALAQFHFHSPAEHTIDRRAYPLELHFVHRNQLGRLAVVGVFFEEGPENAALNALLQHMPHGQGDQAATNLNVDLDALLPADRTYYAYAGSLTTPPCTEGVRWNVMRTPVTASAQQIAALREALGASSRHIQPLHQRTVMLGL